MATYRLKKSLTITPVIILIVLNLFVFAIDKKSEEFMLILICSTALCAILLGVYFYVRLETNHIFFWTPKLVRPKSEFAKWDKIFEVIISKSTTSGYIYQTVSFTNELGENDYFIMGSWFKNSEEFTDELRQKAINAKIIDQRK